MPSSPAGRWVWLQLPGLSPRARLGACACTLPATLTPRPAPWPPPQVPEPWDTSDQEAKPLPTDWQYGCGDSPEAGPSNKANLITSFLAMVLVFFPFALREEIAGWTNTYATEDWVKPKLDGKKGHIRCQPGAAGARHRFKPHKGRRWRRVTAGSVAVYFGILIVASAIGVRQHEQRDENAPRLRPLPHRSRHRSRGRNQMLSGMATTRSVISTTLVHQSGTPPTLAPHSHPAPPTARCRPLTGVALRLPP